MLQSPDRPSLLWSFHHSPLGGSSSLNSGTLQNLLDSLDFLDFLVFLNLFVDSPFEDLTVSVVLDSVDGATDAAAGMAGIAGAGVSFPSM